MKWDISIKAFDTIDKCFKIESCGSCSYKNGGYCLCDTCSHSRLSSKHSEDHHSDNYDYYEEIGQYEGIGFKKFLERRGWW